MSKTNIIRNNSGESFICLSCGKTVFPLEYGGSQRNHCPCCLSSIHVDIMAGDRRARCRGLMKPIGIWTKSHKEGSLIHRCEKCGLIRTNRIAADDNEVMLFMLAMEPLSRLPFPSGKAMNALKELSLAGMVIHE